MTKRKNKNQFYAVAIGRIPGIYTSWDDCKGQVCGHVVFVDRVHGESVVRPFWVLGQSHWSNARKILGLELPVVHQSYPHRRTPDKSKTLISLTYSLIRVPPPVVSRCRRKGSRAPDSRASPRETKHWPSSRCTVGATILSHQLSHQLSQPRHRKNHNHHHQRPSEANKVLLRRLQSLSISMVALVGILVLEDVERNL